MENTTLRTNLHRKLDNIKKDSQLELIDDIINEMIINDSPDDFWHHLTEQEKKAIKEGIIAMDKNKTINNDEVVNKYLK